MEEKKKKKLGHGFFSGSLHNHGFLASKNRFYLVPFLIGKHFFNRVLHETLKGVPQKNKPKNLLWRENTWGKKVVYFGCPARETLNILCRTLQQE